jgi:hypothetical protein
MIVSVIGCSAWVELQMAAAIVSQTTLRDPGGGSKPPWIAGPAHRTSAAASSPLAIAAL